MTGTEEKKRLLSNFVSLSVLQGANYLLPLITFPYLVRVLGVEKFGLLAFVMATVQYFVILTEFGFNLSAARQISIDRDDGAKVSEIFHAVIFSKTLLMMGGLVLMTILVFSFEKFRADWEIYYLTYGMVLGNVLFPIWFFQGMERMKYITYLNIFAKALYVVSIFLFIHAESDFFLVPLLNSLSFILSGCWALWIVYRDFGITFLIPPVPLMIKQLQTAWYLFVSRISISLYTVSTTFVLGLFADNTTVGYFAAGEKIVRAVQGLMQPVVQTLFPYISKLVSRSEREGMLFIRSVTLYVGAVSLFISFLLYLFAEEIVALLLGSAYDPSIQVVRMLSLIPFLVSMAAVFANLTMIPFARYKAYMRIYIAIGVSSLLFAFVLIPSMQLKGASLTLLFAESFGVLLMFFYLYATRLSIFNALNGRQIEEKPNAS